MIDHLVRADDIDALRALLPEYWMDQDEFNPVGGWRADICISDPRVFVLVDSIRQYFPGVFVWIALPVLSTGLRDLPDGACRIIAERETGQILYVAADIAPETLAHAWIEPVPAGSNYPFGNP